MSVAPTECEATSFTEFVQLCETNGLLQRPNELATDDVCDGLNDEVTLRYRFSSDYLLQATNICLPDGSSPRAEEMRKRRLNSSKKRSKYVTQQATSQYTRTSMCQTMKQHGNLSVKEDLCERAKKMNTYTKE
jgi:hypothetical protein